MLNKGPQKGLCLILRGLLSNLVHIFKERRCRTKLQFLHPLNKLLFSIIDNINMLIEIGGLLCHYRI